MIRTGTIYALVDPRTDIIRYIGSTLVKPENRYAQHIYQWKRCVGKMTHVNAWIKSLAVLDLKPVLVIKESAIPEDQLHDKEVFYMMERKTHPSERGWDVSDH